jgi:hypothetical protein
MERCLPAGGEVNRESQMKGRTLFHRSWLRMTVLVFLAGVFSAAVTVAAAREPDPQVAYAPPLSPAVAEVPSAGDPASEATISGTAMGRATASSSWVMPPLPETEGGVAISATQMSPVTTTSMVAAAPR